MDDVQAVRARLPRRSAFVRSAVTARTGGLLRRLLLSQPKFICRPGTPITSLKPTTGSKPRAMLRRLATVAPWSTRAINRAVMRVDRYNVGEAFPLRRLHSRNGRAGRPTQIQPAWMTVPGSTCAPAPMHPPSSTMTPSPTCDAHADQRVVADVAEPIRTLWPIVTSAPRTSGAARARSVTSNELSCTLVRGPIAILPSPATTRSRNRRWRRRPARRRRRRPRSARRTLASPRVQLARGCGARGVARPARQLDVERRQVASRDSPAAVRADAAAAASSSRADLAHRRRRVAVVDPPARQRLRGGTTRRG